MSKTEENIAKWSLLVSTILVILSAVLLVYSFVNLESNGNNEELFEYYLNESSNESKTTKNGTRLVFMVVDAFRLSFLTSDSSPMRFVRESIRNRNAIAFDAYARMPTVTLPRITAYITGTLPSFGTILTNLATDEIKVDNWITRLKKQGKRIHFFGDDTWIRLLPGQFDNYDGVTSFFVNDYTEVDQNVTRHLEKELKNEKKNEWDVMILHYLGLDHIGHSLGGLSDKIEGKLKEMDGIVEKIVNGLKEEADSDTWIIVCGDHGMTQSGSHGGSSNDETRVPVVIWNLGTDRKQMGNERAEIISGRIEQIDVSATIFSIFDLISPSKSYGISLLPKLAEYFGRKLEFDPMLQWNHFWALAKDKSLTDAFSLTCHDDNKCDFSKKFVQDATEADFRKVQEKLIKTASSMPNFQLGIAVFMLFLAAGISLKTMRINFSCFIFLINLIYFASSLIEEEHEIWYFISSTALFLKLALVLRRRLTSQRSSNSISSLRDLLLVLVLHRISFGWMQGSRRRWAMDQSVLPAAVFQDIGDFDVKDVNTIMSNNPVPTLLLATILWIYLSKRLYFLPLFAILSHCLRVSDSVALDAYFLVFLRLLIVPIAYLLKKPSSAILTLILIVSPTSQLVLIAIIYWIGVKLKELELGNAEITALFISAFYYTGNSNSLSTLSLTSAYVGLLDYYPILVGFQLFLSTFSGPIAFLCGFNFENGSRYSFIIKFFFIYRTFSFATSLVCLYIFQHHLFVWSVYSPKVTYDMFHSFFSIIVLISTRF